MKNIIFTLMIMCSLIGCAQKEDFQVELIDDGLIDVTFPVGVTDKDTKTWTGWDGSSNNMYWSKSDSIGIFAGSGNVNRKFYLSSGENSTSGVFSGQMEAVSSPTTLYAYYPYSKGATLDCIPFPDISNQVFEGTFVEKGEFRSFGKYALMAGQRPSFTIEKEWPESSPVNFYHLMGIARFGINSTLSSPVFVRSVGILAATTSFRIPASYNLSTGVYSYYSTNLISSAVSDRNNLQLNTSETKYVQMVVMPNSFPANEGLTVFVRCINNDGRNVQYTVSKTVQPTHSFAAGRRTSISVPIQESSPTNMAKRVKVTTSSTATSLAAPVFVQGLLYETGDAWWGDSEFEKYEAGRTHVFASSGVHAASFNHWGESNSLIFENIRDIEAIDFSNVY